MPYKDKERERERQRIRRKSKQYKKYQREYQKKWREQNKEKWKEIVKKSENRPERKKYIKEWQNNNPKFKEIRKRFQNSKKQKEYQKKWTLNNKDKISEKHKRYNKTSKGILNKIKKVQRRRIKFKKIAGVYYNIPRKDLIELVNKRDKVCVYCGCKFSEDNNSKNYGTYDHLDAFKAHSKKNTVKYCSSCNSSKGAKDVLVWLSEKGMKPSKKILNLVKNSEDKL